jgi:hypothetical protein
MPVLPPGGGLAICAVGRAAWGMEWRLAAGGNGRKVWDLSPEEVKDGGVEAVLRCPVGWSGDHRVVSLSPFSFSLSSFLFPSRIPVLFASVDSCDTHPTWRKN